jgi:hypothetical protein
MMVNLHFLKFDRNQSIILVSGIKFVTDDGKIASVHLIGVKIASATSISA